MRLQVTFNLPDTVATLQRDHYTGITAEQKVKQLTKVEVLARKAKAGLTGGTVKVQVVEGGTQASGTVTCASVSAADTVTVNGRVYTAVSSGATGQQFNCGGTDTATATSLAAAINADTNGMIAGLVTASSAAGVVTVTAVPYDETGNQATLASSNGVRLAVSGARLTGGVSASSLTYNG